MGAIRRSTRSRDAIGAFYAHFGEWTRAFEPDRLMERLQAAHVPAGVVQTKPDLLADPRLAHRGHWVPTEHAHLGTLLVERAGFRLSDGPGGFSRPGPLLGEHTDAILSEILGLDAAEIASLRARGVLS